MQEGERVKDRAMETKPTKVPETATQDGEALRALWPWVEPSIWTDRMLASLMKGVKGKAALAQASAAGKGAAKGDGFDFGTVFTCFLLIIGYFAIMQWLGFYLSAFLFFVASTMILGRKDLTVRKGAFRVVAGLIFVSILYILFNVILVVQTPKGLFI